MKKANSIIIATVIATFVISIFAFQPTSTEARNNVLPPVTPTPKKLVKSNSIIAHEAEEAFKNQRKQSNRKSKAANSGQNLRKPNRRKVDNIGTPNPPTTTISTKRVGQNKHKQMRKSVGGYDTHTSQRKRKVH